MKQPPCGSNDWPQAGRSSKPRLSAVPLSKPNGSSPHLPATSSNTPDASGPANLSPFCAGRPESSNPTAPHEKRRKENHQSVQGPPHPPARQFPAFIREYMMRNEHGVAPTHAAFQKFFNLTPPSVILPIRCDFLPFLKIIRQLDPDVTANGKRPCLQSPCVWSEPGARVVTWRWLVNLQQDNFVDLG